MVTMDMYNMPMGSFTVPADQQAAAQVTPDTGFDWAGLLSDPNVIQALGALGGIAGEGSVGQIMGSAGANLARNKALQATGAKQSQRQASFQEQLLKALTEGRLLSPKNQDNAFDEVKLDGDGGVSLTMRPTPQTPGFQGEQLPLEAQAAARRGDDLPNFFKGSLD